MPIAKLDLDIQACIVIFKDPEDNDASGWVVFGTFDDAVASLREDAIESWDDYHEPDEPDPRIMSVEDLLSGGYGYPVWHIVEASVFGRVPHLKATGDQ